MSDAVQRSDGSATTSPYVGRFAPSPTGPLHAGSLVAALASWLDARVHGGRWLVRIEDVDLPRCVPGVAEIILSQLARCGLVSDDEPWVQSRGEQRYAAAMERLIGLGCVYACSCSRRDIEQALRARGEPPQRHRELVYPGTCRPDSGGLQGRPARAMRLKVDGQRELAWTDRRLGAQGQDLVAEVGDFVLHRADGLWAYQMAVVVDDAAQDITDVVRGEDLADNTPRQIHLQRCLDLPAVRYLHTPLVLGEDGQKLSKQNGARPLDLDDPLAALNAAAKHLDLVVDTRGPCTPLADWLGQAASAWKRRWVA
jgi:glutamyl-Q tRNA(Asp) synthetase